MKSKLTLEEIEARSLGLAKEVAEILLDKRTKDVKLLDVRRTCSYTDYLIVGTITSQPQTRGIAKDIERAMKERNLKQLSREGLVNVREIEGGLWVLLDYGDIIVHLFDEEMREYYDTEELWASAEEVECE